MPCINLCLYYFWPQLLSKPINRSTGPQFRHMSDFSRPLDHIIFLFKSHQWYPLILGKPESFEHWPLPDPVTLLTALPSCTACGILVPWLGIDPRPPAMRARSPNHWTTSGRKEDTLPSWTLHSSVGGGGFALYQICLASLPLCVPLPLFSVVVGPYKILVKWPGCFIFLITAVG